MTNTDTPELTWKDAHDALAQYVTALMTGMPIESRDGAFNHYVALRAALADGSPEDRPYTCASCGETTIITRGNAAPPLPWPDPVGWVCWKAECARTSDSSAIAVPSHDGHNHRDTGRTLAQKHQEHYRSCNCLGDSSECCVETCECHVENGSKGAS